MPKTNRSQPSGTLDLDYNRQLGPIALLGLRGFSLAFPDQRSGYSLGIVRQHLIEPESWASWRP